MQCSIFNSLHHCEPRIFCLHPYPRQSTLLSFPYEHPECTSPYFPQLLIPFYQLLSCIQILWPHLPLPIIWYHSFLHEYLWPTTPGLLLISHWPPPKNRVNPNVHSQHWLSLSFKSFGVLPIVRRSASVPTSTSLLNPFHQLFDFPIPLFLIYNSSSSHPMNISRYHLHFLNILVWNLCLNSSNSGQKQPFSKSQHTQFISQLE